ncbi:MAG: AEC family transporter [Eubacteriales bacterium]|nr:AEC family transporter [Eubacteriales bacterium]
MENLLFALEVVLPLFAAVFLGYFLRIKNVIDDRFIGGANKLSFRVILPMLLFYNIVSNDISGAVDAKLVGFAVASVLVLVGLLVAFLPLIVKERPKCGVLIQGVFRTNFLLFGLQLVTNIFGPQGTGPVAMLVAIIVPLFNVLAVLVLTLFSARYAGGQRPSWKSIALDVVKNPLIIASALGFAVSALPFELPRFILLSVKDISAMATPLALLALGGTFRFHSAWKNVRYLALGVVGRLLAVPVVLLGLAIAVGFRGEQLAALLALYASPVAVSSYVMAVQTECDGDLAAELVVFSTVFSAFTIFGFVYVCKALGFF